MGLFDRFKKDRPLPAHEEAPETEAAPDALDEPAEPAPADLDDDADIHPKEAPRDRSENGPFDAAEDAPERHRLNLGPVAVPVIDGMQIRLETEQDSDRILAVTMIHSGGAMQLQAFAAPRGEGIWKSVRDEIAEGVRARKGKADELYTDLGNELVTQVPVRTKDGRTGVRVTRFAGIDGPRWFLRAVFSGSAVTDKETRSALVGLLRGAVVDRGTEARPPRELLPLVAPTVASPGPGQPAQQVEAGAPQDQATGDDDIDPFERGPEIAEIR
ncbi:MAG TPA: DUF3710 domain-containing protein [Candidatus Brevibacterium intestinigallinarum]|nr:DUF3710 domain-containing protein [Candidatus Brevibacterium intestinigallinarum]